MAAWEPFDHERFLHKAVIVVQGIVPGDRIDVAFDFESLIYAEDAGVSGAGHVLEGEAVLYAEDVPDGDLTGTYVIFKAVT